MSTEIKLKQPLDDGGTEITVITLRRPVVRDILAIDTVEGNVKKSVVMIAQLSDLSVDVIEGMDASDFANISEKVAVFLE